MTERVINKWLRFDHECSTHLNNMFNVYPQLGLYFIHLFELMCIQCFNLFAFLIDFSNVCIIVTKGMLTQYVFYAKCKCV